MSFEKEFAGWIFVRIALLRSFCLYGKIKISEKMDKKLSFTTPKAFIFVIMINYHL